MDSNLYSYYYENRKNKSIDSKLVMIESHNGIDFAGNMLHIAMAIQKQRDFIINLVWAADNYYSIKHLVDHYKLDCIRMIERESKEYFESLACAKFLFTDVTFYPLFTKREGQICITTWHGTPLKTLGFDYMEDEYVVGNQKKGFAISDYFVCPNEYTFNKIKKSYQLESIFEGEKLLMGYPRNEVFLREENNYLRKELGLEGKKVVVYMPTWRGKVIDVKSEGQVNLLQNYLKEWDSLLNEDTIVLAKLHRLNAADLDFGWFDKIIPFPEGYDSYEVLNCADILVTDYSSVMFDYAVTRKKIILFCYDKEDYINNRCCYFNIDELPFPIVSDVKSLVYEIDTEKEYDDENVLHKFCANETNNSAEKICELILRNGEAKAKKTKSLDTLLFVGDLRKGKETDAFFFESDKFENNLYVTYLNHLFTKNWYKLLQLRKYNHIPFAMFQGSYIHYLNGEREIINRIRQNIKEGKNNVSKADLNILDNIYVRETSRMFYDKRIKTFIRYNGLDLDSLKFFAAVKAKKIIYVHESMEEKANNDSEYSFYLWRAISLADEIRFANENIYAKMEKKVKKTKGKIIILNLY